MQMFQDDETFIRHILRSGSVIYGRPDEINNFHWSKIIFSKWSKMSMINLIEASDLRFRSALGTLRRATLAGISRFTNSLGFRWKVTNERVINSEVLFYPLYRFTREVLFYVPRPRLCLPRSCRRRTQHRAHAVVRADFTPRELSVNPWKTRWGRRVLSRRGKAKKGKERGTISFRICLIGQ